MTSKTPLRFAVVGVGIVYEMHARALKSSDVEVVGVSDINVAAAEREASEFGCPFFADHRQMLSATSPDAVAILAPHPFHAPIAIDCLESGAHVLVEKPIAVEVVEADRMIEAAKRAGRLLAVNFQHRTRGDIRAARKIVQSGRLGQLQRVELVATWPRTAAYYAQAAWRGTWQGEGGGVLMNQAPHSLDLMCHLVGQPRRVAAWNRTSFHAIPTEDTSLAMLEWSGGGLGTTLVTTAQTGEPEWIEIVGTGGMLRLSRGRLEVLEADTDLREFLAQRPEPFAKPTLRPIEVSPEPGGGNHTAIYANFLAAIRANEPLVADGSEGRLSLELANAFIYSSSRGGQAVDLPLDRGAYSRLLAELRVGTALEAAPAR